MTTYNIETIANQFILEGKFMEAKPFGSGHINNTYLVSFNENQRLLRYILQKINHNVFKKPLAVMENIVRVTEHIHKKLLTAGTNDISRSVLTVINTSDNTSCYKDADGNYWRMYIFIENVRTYDAIESPEQAYEAARTFGRFQKMLADFPATALNETIPDFHNTPKRFQTFKEVLKTDPHNRAKNVKAEIDFISNHASICNILLDLVDKGKIPVSIIHNDTKINNVLFDTDTNKGLCVIDLDTVMPGLTLYDFGDMVRTAVSTADEDEVDLSKITMQMPLFEALVRGFLDETAQFLTQSEKQHLVSAGKVITFEQAIRFLTDYLERDVYYKIHRDGHNLDRCRSQFKLVEQMIQHEDEMKAIVENYPVRNQTHFSTPNP